MQQQVTAAGTYAQRYLTDVVGVTGAVAAQYEQGQIIDRDLALGGAVHRAGDRADRRRQVPVAARAARRARLRGNRVPDRGPGGRLGRGQRTGIALPQEADPVLVVLLLGVTTDYCVFFLSGMRSRLAEGADRLQAVRDSTAESAPIVLAAGLIVAAGTGALLVARGGLLRAFGPGLAATVLVAMVVSLTLMPALLGLLSRVIFRHVAPARLPRPGTRRSPGSPPPGRWRCWWSPPASRDSGSRPRPPGGLGLGSPLIGEMPSSSTVARASAAASAGFAPGILAPTEVLVIGPGAGSQVAADRRMAEALRDQPGVASVVGPSVLTGSVVPASASEPDGRQGRVERSASR